MEESLLVVHALPLEELDGVVDRVSLFGDRRISVMEFMHFQVYMARELICHADPSVHGAVDSIAEGELYFDMDFVAPLLHDVADCLDQHHLRGPDIGIVAGVIPCSDKRYDTVPLKALVELFHFAIEIDQRDRIVILLLVLLYDALKSSSFVILMDRSFNHYGRHMDLPSWW